MGRPKKEKPTHSSGMYTYRATIGHNIDGSGIRKTFYSSKSKADAKLKAEEFKVKQAVSEITGERLVEKNMTFSRFALLFLESVKGDVKNITYDLTYRNTIDIHLIPYFGDAVLNSIRQINIKSYIKEKAKTLSAETLKKHRRILSAMFKSAVINGFCMHNPVVKIKIPAKTNRDRESKKRTYAKDQAEKVIEFARTHRFGAAIILMLSYGISRSELLGLEWADFDYKSRVLMIRRGVTEAYDPDMGKLVIEVGEPKNDYRRRDIPISQVDADFFMNLPKTIVVGKSVKAGRPGKEVKSKYFITNKKGETCAPKTWRRWQYDVFMKEMHEYYINLEGDEKTDIPILNPHELRHSRATLWVSEGYNLIAIANVLGHADLRMLKRIYAHPDTEINRKLLNIE